MTAVPTQRSVLSLLWHKTWIAWLALAMFALLSAYRLEAAAGFCSTLAAVWMMNGLAKTDDLLQHRTPAWWHNHPILKFFHFVNGEGELAGIFCAFVLWTTLQLVQSPLLAHLHFPIAEAFTLYGIMSAAKILVLHMAVLMNSIEQVGNRFGARGGRFAVLFVGSLLSSLSGEPAAATFLTEYVAKRVKPGKKAKVATGLAASIGSGGGLLPFAAPPILIVWGILSRDLGWSYFDLLRFVGLGCVLHAGISALLTLGHLEQNGHKQGKLSRSLPWVFLLGALVVAHIVSHSMWVYVVDAFIGLGTTMYMADRYRKVAEEIVASLRLVDEDQRHGNEEYSEVRERGFTDTWQPLILGVLLIGLEVVGLTAEPFISAAAGFIPTWLPLWLVGLLIAEATAFTSHFADNALASRVFIVIAVTMGATMGPGVATFIAICVISGALFGGFLTIPGNLPNFVIARVLGVDSGEWIKAALPLYLSGIAYVASILIWYAILVGF